MNAVRRFWLVDANNVFGSRPDGWWNDRPKAAARFAQRVAEWCRTHGDDVVVVFDGSVDAATAALAGGNLTIEFASRRGRNAADDAIVERAAELVASHDELVEAIVVTSDRGLRARLDDRVAVVGSGSFRSLIGY